jgi:hypothetical protein
MNMNRISSRVGRSLLASLLITLFIATVAGPASAQTDPPTPVTTTPPTPVTTTPPVVLDPLDPAGPSPAQGDERHGRPAGTENLLGFDEYPDPTNPVPLSHYDIGCDEGAWNHATRKAYCLLQSIPFGWTKMVVGAGNTILVWALQFKVSRLLAPLVESLSSALHSRLILGLQVQHMVWFLVAAWVGWLLLNSRTSKAWGEFITSFLIAGAAFFMVTIGPVAYYDGAVTTIQGATASVLSATTSGSDCPAVPGRERSEGDVAACATARTIQYAFVHQPYEIINWGSSPAPCPETVNEILAEGPWGAADKPRDMMNDAGCNDAAEFNHDAGLDRMGAAVAVAFAATLLFVLLVLIALTLIAASVVLFVLFAVSSVVFVIAIAPGPGRVLLWQWISALAQVFLVTVGCAFCLTFLAAGVAAAMTAEGTSLILRCILMDVMVVVAFFLRHRLVTGSRRAGYKIAQSINRATPAATTRMRPNPSGAMAAGVTGFAIGSRARAATERIPGGYGAIGAVDARREAMRDRTNSTTRRAVDALMKPADVVTNLPSSVRNSAPAQRAGRTVGRGAAAAASPVRQGKDRWRGFWESDLDEQQRTSRNERQRPAPQRTSSRSTTRDPEAEWDDLINRFYDEQP